MAVTSKLNQQDISFLTNLIADITNELCECDCCKKEQGCSIFERVYVAANVLYRNVADFSSTPATDNLNILADTETCIDWGTITQRINTNSATKGRFVDKSRKKLLSRFYKSLYDIIDGYSNDTIPAYDSTFEALTLAVFGPNAENVISNCLDECCN